MNKIKECAEVSDIFNKLLPNIRVPQCLGIFKNKNNEIWLWMEYVQG